MPFQSKAQARYLHAQHPEIAGRWEKHTSRKKRKRLPERVGKSQYINPGRADNSDPDIGYRPITQMRPYERAALRDQIKNFPGVRLQLNGKLDRDSVNQIIRLQSEEHGRENARQVINDKVALGVTYPARNGKAKYMLASKDAFKDNAERRNASGRHKGRTNWQKVKREVVTHEHRHVDDMEAMPRKAMLRRYYDMWHNKGRMLASHAAMEGRAVGHANRVHGHTPNSYDRFYEKPSRGRDYNQAHQTKRESVAYHAGKKHPDTVLHQYKRYQAEVHSPEAQRNGADRRRRPVPLKSRDYRRDTRGRFSKSQLMPSGLLVALAGKEPTANLGYKAITQMSRRERDILRGEMLIKPDRFRENGRDSREAVSYVSQHRSNPEPEALANARRLVGRTSRQGVGQTLGVTFPTKPGHAEIVTMPRREFNRFSAAENRGVKPGKPRVSGRDLQVRTMTHEQRHAEEIRSKPRRAELRDTWHAVHNPARREAQKAATEGRAVGHTNRKLGPKDEMYDDVYKPTKKGLRRNKYDKTPRETRAYNAAKEHPDSTLRQYRRDQGGRFSKMSHAVRRYELAKSQLVGQGFKAVTEMAPKERNLLRRQITHNPVERLREPAQRVSAQVRQDIKPGARRAHAEYARQAIDEGETLGVAYRTGPGKATTKLADPPAFDREARMQNKLARAQGVKKPGYTGQQMRDVTHTHELHHAAELKSMPRKTELQHAYTGVANPARADAHHAAMEGRAVGQANAVHGPLPSNYDQTYKVPRGVKAKQNMAGSTRREATAYHAAKANPNTLLHRFGKKMPSQLETPTQRYQRHQHQAAAALTATAAVPALMALRSGRMASQAIAARNPAEHAIHASSQLKHAASATALGGLAGAANAMPTPHRLLNQNSKTKKIKVASKISGHSPAHGKSAASGYTKEGFGKSNAAQTERTKHYRRMSNTMGAMGAIGTGLASGAKVVGHLEGKGKDPVGFTHRTKNAYRTRPMPAPMQEKVLNHFSQVHANQAKAVGMVTVPALGAAAAYKYKQRQSMKKSFTPKTKQRAKQAGAVGAGASVAGLGALAVPGGLGDTKIMGHDVHAAGRGALAAHRRIGAHNAGTEHLDEDALRFARTQRRVGLRSMAIKGPATVGAAGIAAAGGAAGYEVGRHALATAKIKGRERRRG